MSRNLSLSPDVDAEAWSSFLRSFSVLSDALIYDKFAVATYSTSCEENATHSYYKNNLSPKDTTCSYCASKNYSDAGNCTQCGAPLGDVK